MCELINGLFSRENENKYSFICFDSLEAILILLESVKHDVNYQNLLMKFILQFEQRIDRRNYEFTKGCKYAILRNQYKAS